MINNYTFNVQGTKKFFKSLDISDLKNKIAESVFKDTFGKIRKVKLAEVRIGTPVLLNGKIFLLSKKGKGQITLTLNGQNKDIPFEQGIREYVTIPDIG